MVDNKSGMPVPFLQNKDWHDARRPMSEPGLSHLSPCMRFGISKEDNLPIAGCCGDGIVPDVFHDSSSQRSRPPLLCNASGDSGYYSYTEDVAGASAPVWDTFAPHSWPLNPFPTNHLLIDDYRYMSSDVCGSSQLPGYLPMRFPETSWTSCHGQSQQQSSHCPVPNQICNMCGPLPQCEHDSNFPRTPMSFLEETPDYNPFSRTRQTTAHASECSSSPLSMQTPRDDNNFHKQALFTTSYESMASNIGTPPSSTSLIIGEPPATDHHQLDPLFIPHVQALRSPDDLYTPRWVRGQGTRREGWCGLCRPGRWLALKNSAFWYDKTFTHGVSAGSGRSFDPPKATRTSSDAHKRTRSSNHSRSESKSSPGGGDRPTKQGLCGTCNQWVGLGSGRKGRELGLNWFRHAYKCENSTRGRVQSSATFATDLGPSPDTDHGKSSNEPHTHTLCSSPGC